MSNHKILIKQLAREIKINPHLSNIKTTIRKLSEENVDLNTKIYRGRTLMHYAVKANSRGFIKTLFAYGVNPAICDDDFNTPLHYAIIHSKYQAAEELLKIGADPNSLGEFDQTPLHLAATKGNLDMARLLIENGADIYSVDEKNQTPLDYAKDENNIEIIYYLEKVKKGEENEI